MNSARTIEKNKKTYSLGIARKNKLFQQYLVRKFNLFTCSLILQRILLSNSEVVFMC